MVALLQRVDEGVSTFDVLVILKKKRRILCFYYLGNRF